MSSVGLARQYRTAANSQCLSRGRRCTTKAHLSASDDLVTPQPYRGTFTQVPTGPGTPAGEVPTHRQLQSPLPHALQRSIVTEAASGGFMTLSIDSSCKRQQDRGRHGHEDEPTDYSKETIIGVASSRTGWLLVFCIGLLLAALVVEQFEDILEHHVELSFFVPLIMGHGGNTGSQSVTTVIRALALKQVTNRDVFKVVLKEAGAGCLMGSVLGLSVLAFSCVWSGISTQVGATVAMSLPLVSLWANGLGALLTMLADRLKFDPAVTSVPFMTTIVDSTGLVIYFYIAKWMLGISDPVA